MTIIGVLSWTRGDGASITKQHRERYGITFPLLHDGPVTNVSRWSPTTFLLDKSGKTVAWQRGEAKWNSAEVRALLEALAK